MLKLLTEINIPAQMKHVTILITDDHKLIRESWTFILNDHPGFRVIAHTGTGEEAIELAQQLRPAVVIMDINLPGINGIEATTSIRKFSPGSKIIGVSLHSQPAYARKILKAGAVGYITKNSSSDELIRAIETVINNKVYICDEIKNIIAEQLTSVSHEKTGTSSLSCREIEILEHIKNGLSSREIAQLLDISAKTVEVHRYNIMKKLNLKNVAALVNYINYNGFFQDRLSNEN
jgi:two-component system invasion response regulator UvrY